jgi:RNA polymerase sigma-70 factor, ECF subfamily
MSIDLHTEARAIVLAQSDTDAFKVIYQEYVNDVFRYVLHIAGDREAAKDITSETFLIALSKLATYEQRGISIKFWLLQIAHNLALKSRGNIYKNQSVSLDTVPEQELQSSERILDKLIDSEEQQLLRKQIEKLEPAEKNILLLRTVEELTFSDIASLTGQGLSAVKMTYYRALGKLKQGLAM